MTDPKRAHRARRHARVADFTSETEARAAAAAHRARFATAAEAASSPAWPQLHRRLTRWVLKTAAALGNVDPEERAAAIAKIYITRPELLWELGPPGVE
jgi:hypothetical protein